MAPFLPLIADVVAAAVILISALRGRHRGLIKTLAGILALFLSFSFAGTLAKNVSPVVSEKFVSPYLESSILPKAEDLDASSSADSASVSKLFTDIGIPEDIVSDAVEDIGTSISNSIREPILLISNNVALKITHAVLFIVFFLILLLIFSLLLKLLNILAKIPGVNFINKTLGLILGLVLGYLITVLLSLVFSKLGILLTEEVVSETFLIKLLLNSCPLV